VLGADWISDFEAQHSRRHNDEVQLYAFDILALDGEDLLDPTIIDAQDEPGTATRAPAGWHLCPEQGEIGPDLFRKTCVFGSERLKGPPAFCAMTDGPRRLLRSAPSRIRNSMNGCLSLGKAACLT
jgi:hypothetical protein